MTWHAYSFGEHYDPERVGFGPMICHDEHLLADGRGFDTHHHGGVDIVTWVVSGALTHRDSMGGSATLTPGWVGVLCAGSGVEHSEVAAAPATRFVQVWLPSSGEQSGDSSGDSSGGGPSYAARPVTLVDGTFVPAVGIRDAAYSVARLDAGQAVTLPTAPLRHLFVASGALLRSSLAEPLQAGDAFTIRGEDEVSVAAAVPTQLLLWAFGA